MTQEELWLDIIKKIRAGVFNQEHEIARHFAKTYTIEVRIVKPELIYPFTSTAFMNIWELLIAEPKWKKKTNNALQMALKFMSDFPENVAIEMMEQSISGGYQGLFKVKSGKKNEIKDNTPIWRR